jgi:hypothetical protein
VTGAAEKSTSGNLFLMGDLPATDGTTDAVSIELYKGYGVFTNGFAPGSYLLAGEELDYATCGLCVLLYGNIDTTAKTIGSYYMATGGSVTITETVTGVVGTGTNLTFEHVQIDQSTGASTTDPDGCQSAMTALTFNGTLPVTCNPFAQTGCQPGEGCYFDTTAKDYACAPAGAVAPGGVCTIDGDCAAGLTCVGQCTPWCEPATTPTTCAGTGAVCADFGDGFGGCQNNLCNAVAQDCTTATDGCYPEALGLTCEAAGSAAPGATCVNPTDCVKGASCFSASGVKSCYTLCDPSAATSTCGTGKTCYKLTATLGACVTGP